jgi:hypothetical protein
MQKYGFLFQFLHSGIQPNYLCKHIHRNCGNKGFSVDTFVRILEICGFYIIVHCTNPVTTFGLVFLIVPSLSLRVF